MLNQDFHTENFELILVNDSGKPLRTGNWGESNRLKVLTTQQRERSVARNTGAAIAKGRYLHFLDDDDWLLPGAFNAFWELSKRSQSKWLYGGTQLVNRDGKDIIRLEHNLRGNCFTQIMAGEWIPLQSSLIHSDLFFQVGGFSPSLIGPEDVDLCRRIALHGDFDFTPKLIACVGMGSESSSTDYSQSLITARVTRESILDQPGVFQRLRSSAKTNGLKGRMVRIYLTSAVWNMNHQKLTKAIGRLGFALVSFFGSGRSIFSSGYWRALSNPYKSETFLRGFQEANLPVTSR